MSAPGAAGTLRYDGADSRKMLPYAKDRRAARAAAFKDRPMSLLDNANWNGASIVDNSQAYLTQEELVKTAPSVYLMFVRAWIESATTDAMHAARMAEMVTSLHPKDQRMEGYSLQELARASRARFYAIPGNQRHMEAVKVFVVTRVAGVAVEAVAADPANNIAAAAAVAARPAEYGQVYHMPSAEECARVDEIDAKMSEAARTHFAMGPARDILTELRDAVDNLAFSPERQPMAAQLRKLVDDVLDSAEAPTFDQVYWKMMGAMHARATPAQTAQFLALTARADETMEAWSIRYYQEWEFCKAWVTITTPQLSSCFMVGVRAIHPEVHYYKALFVIASLELR